MHSKKSGLSLVELLVSIAITVLVISLILPAVLHVRESSRRVTCQNNLRQTAIAVQSYYGAMQQIPSLYGGSFEHQGTVIHFPKKYWDEHHFHSWQTTLLPYLEQNALYQKIVKNSAATNPSNQSIAKMELSVFLCPSTNAPTRFRPIRQYSPNDIIGVAARTDYEPAGGLELGTEAIGRMLSKILLEPGIWGLPKHVPGRSVDQDNSYEAPRRTTFREVTDGLSNTIAIGEMAGRPDRFVRGKLENRDNLTVHSAWAISGHYGSFLVAKGAGINESNYHAAFYSFHPSGAHVAFSDGAVRLLSVSTDTNTIHAMVTKSKGDISTDHLP